MQKKLEADLMSLAHQILKMQKGGEVLVLKQKAYEVYEKLAVLAYINTYVKETPTNHKTVEELALETFSEVTQVQEKEKTVENKEIEEAEQFTKVTSVTDTLKNTGTSEVEKETNNQARMELFSNLEAPSEEVVKSKTAVSLEKEFEHTVSLDIATEIFENAARVTPKKSIHDAILQQKNLQIDLNDRIAFVKHLFDNSQEDFNRVISQLNTLTSQKEAAAYIKMIKKEYNWGGKEIYEERLLVLIERKFN